MKNSKRVLLVENRGKYVDIAFYAGLFSGIIVFIYSFLSSLFHPEVVTPLAKYSGLFPLKPSGVILVHIAISFVLGLVLGYNKKISFNSFISISVVVGTLLESLLNVHHGSIFSLIFLAINWFIFSIVFLVFEKIFSENKVFTEK